jgi:hypothetical protein
VVVNHQTDERKVGAMTHPDLAIDAQPPLTWVPVEGEPSVDQTTQTLSMRSAAGVEWTNDATGGAQQHQAASLAFVAPSAPFTLSTNVSVIGDRTTFDAGALSIWSDVVHWAKLCFEFSREGEPLVVSVVTYM